MSGYGYESDSYGGGYGGGSSYGYVMYLPGGGLDATQGLAGPGTSAYYQQGQYTSYASESYRGGIFEQNTTTNGRYTSTSTSYSYKNGYYQYSSYELAHDFNVPAYYGRAYGGYADITSNYMNSTETRTFDGAYTQAYRTSSTYDAYSDGTYTQHFSTLSLSYVDGTLVPGSETGSEFTVSGYIGGYDPQAG